MSGGLKILCTVHSEDMVSARSFVGMGRPFRLPAPTGKEEAALVELANMGLTCRPDDHRPGQDDDDRWFLTGKAATVMQVHLRLEQPALVFLGRKGIPLHDKTALELFEDLRGQGFTLLEGQDLSKFKGKAYAGGSGKTQKVLVCLQRDYLMAMCNGSRLFANGCKGIYHFQLVSYYVALVKVSNKDIPKVIPFKKAVFYRSLWDSSVENPEDQDKSWMCLG